MINDNLTPGERAYLLRYLGFKIDRNRGYIPNIHNINYKDNRPSLCIDLNRGLANDFGDSAYSGDIISLIQYTIDKDFAETVEWIEGRIGRKLEDNYIRDTKTKEQVKKEDSKMNTNFWDKERLKKLKYCNKLLKKYGVTSKMGYINDYDGIYTYQLIRKGCGIYPHSYGDLEFGESESKKYLSKSCYIFPYKTGAMLYRREGWKDGQNTGEKWVRHIKGSLPSKSFFGVSKKDEAKSVAMLMKSPRETLSFSQYCNSWNVFGLATGEQIKQLGDEQILQLQRLIPAGDKLKLYTFLDGREGDDHIGKSIETMRIIQDEFPKSIEVYHANIYKITKGRFDDITDMCRHPKAGEPYSAGHILHNVPKKAGKLILRAIAEAKPISEL